MGAGVLAGAAAQQFTSVFAYVHKTFEKNNVSILGPYSCAIKFLEQRFIRIYIFAYVK